MASSVISRKWWILLIQGIFMVILSIIIFNNPDAVLATLSIWLGIIVIITGMAGLISYFITIKDKRDIYSLIGSSVVLVIGFLLFSKIGITMKVITLLFGFMVAAIGVILIGGSWPERKKWSLWWTISLIGIIAFALGIKSIVDVYSGAQTISFIIGISVLFSGIGLVILSFLKKKILNALDSIKNR